MSTSTKYNFQGKVALVTGSSSVIGIGTFIALQFATYGADVVITGRDVKTLSAVGERIKKETGKVPLEIVADLLKDETPAKLINETIAKFGRLDVLVNNAGGGTVNGKLVNNPKLLDSFDNVMRLNLRSVVELLQLAVPHLEKTKGNVVNISSIASVVPVDLVYCTSKAALDMVTKCAAQELGSKGIRVNSVNPGPVKTGIARSVGGPETFTEEIIKTYSAKTSLNRIAIPEEIANLVSFLASDDAVNMTGGIYVSDGGYLVKQQ